ncbi:MAG: hypothetical protein IKJ43_00555 [Bacilli bacterium]|nr:hypothetical protein [Bacilli bacterium]
MSKDISFIFEDIEFTDDDLSYLNRESIKSIIPKVRELSVRFVYKPDDNNLMDYYNLVSELDSDEKLFVYDLMKKYMDNLLDVLTEKKSLIYKRER